jgi:arylsulfatase A-like enzyme
VSPSRIDAAAGAASADAGAAAACLAACLRYNPDHNHPSYATDNGGNLAQSGNNRPLRGGKYTLFEGGCRVTSFLAGGALPAAVRGSSTPLLMHEVDWLPTFLSLAGAQPTDPQIDGVDQWAALTTPTQQQGAPPRTTVVYNIDPIVQHGTNLSAIRVGDWKLIEGLTQKPDVRPTADHYQPLCSSSSMSMASADGGQDCLQDLHSQGPWLFNLKTDPTEAHNLYVTESGRVSELRAALAAAVADGLVYPLNAPGAAGSHKAPLNVTCPIVDGQAVWTPWVKMM